jgi:peroxiredoxin
LERLEERRAEFEAKGARVAAVSVDPVDVSQELATRLGLGFPLLADEKGALIRAFGVWHADKEISLPAVVVVDRHGVVRWRRVSSSVSDRPDEDSVLEILGRLPQ